MEVMDSPLNQAHYYSQKANRLVAKEKYEEAILCHGQAAELLKEALSTTQSEQVRLSLAIQRHRLLQQQQLIQVSCTQGQLKEKTTVSFSKHTSVRSSQTVLQYEAQPPPVGRKMAKNDKTRLEEQSTAIADLWNLVALLLKENEQLSEEHEKLKVENARLKRGLDEERPLTSVAESAKMFSARSVNHLNVPINLQERIRLLWERANEN
ncbi:hypothetical protein E1301_Tti006248 [Triplophysa tibetana]|uniref:Nuclear receptor-binding factor 2 MIT domain-containing protein n=1 Tax=Triplophysa tibetana TaxID=1572043 RepID=A0A5A9NR61_9TELE|nr:hypothetical protein E1301_Tti006248 [Triplophysa tibetana]